MEQVCIVLKGLNCANCAGKIESSVKKMTQVEDASLNFTSQELKIQFSGGSKDLIIRNVQDITNAIEPEVDVFEKGEGEREKKTYRQKWFLFDRAGIWRITRMVLGAVLFVAALLTEQWDESVRFALYLSSYLLFGAGVIVQAIKNIMRGDWFDENFLMSLSTIGAFAISQYPEAVAVMIFYQVGEFFNDLAVDKSRRSIKALMDIKPEYANLWKDGVITVVLPGEVSAGDMILVKPGEKRPLDGIVVEGNTELDASSLIGESMLQSVGPGDMVLSGAVNKTGVIKMEVTKRYEESTVAKILDLVENASSKKAPAEKFITRFSKVYTPIVVSAAILLAIVPPIATGGNFSEWLSRALVFLVVSCPCALVVSVPLTFFSGIGACSKKGILVKGGNDLQTLQEADTIVFDKTGTLTKGEFEVTAVVPEDGVTLDALLRAACVAECMSNHPIARSIMKAAGADEIMPDSFEEISGMGLRAIASDREILAGNARLMESHGITCSSYNGPGSVVYIAERNMLLGHIVVSDVVKEEAAETMEALKRLGINDIIMLTGDRKEAAEQVAEQLGICVFSQLLPQDKVEKLEKIYEKNPNAKVMFVGDGINDAPVLARANAGIAMGGVGSDAAVEAADIVIMNDELLKIPLAITTARRTMQIVRQNIIFALAVKFSVLLLAVFGLASMWLAVFADVGVEVLVVLNSMKRK